jgi:hypothetical protein
MFDPKEMFAWAIAVDDACMAVRQALERVEAVGGAASAAEVAAAKAVVANIPPTHTNQPSVQILAAHRLAQAADALGRVEAPGGLNPREREVHIAEIASAMHCAAARAQAGRFAAFAAGISHPGPLKPSLIAWSCHWDATAYVHEAMGRFVSGVDPITPNATLVQGLRGTVDTMEGWVSATEAAFDANQPTAEDGPIEPALKAAFDSYRETIAIDRETVALWRKLVADPEAMIQPRGRETLNALSGLDQRRANLHGTRMDTAKRAGVS